MNPEPNARSGRATIIGLLAGLFVAVGLSAWGLLTGAIEKGKQVSCLCHGGNITQALVSYALKNGHYPPAHIDDEHGRPMHSWRVLLLPYLDQKALYDRYRFDEPWDGPNNSKLHSIIMSIYCCPSEPVSTKTSYAVVTGPHTAFPPNRVVYQNEIAKHDGTRTTVLIVEASDAGIHWMEPRDLSFESLNMGDTADKANSISSHHRGVCIVGFADGRRGWLSRSAPLSEVKALLTIDGGEPFPESGLFK